MEKNALGKLGSTGYRKGIFGPPHVRDDGELDPALCGRCREIFKYLIDEPEDSLLQGMNPEWYHSGFRFDTRWELVFVPGEDKEWSLLEVGRNWTAAPVRWSRRPGLYVTAYRSPENSFVQMTLSAAKPVDKRDAPDWDVPEEATVEEVPSVDNGKALGRKGWW
ncbi:hypothetical protein H2203_007812 [Taxawa tesnikishii (nom. ined.)]|nr:hypothetical protein H2203_007812 [Dothideales sp. JES 119]